MKRNLPLCALHISADELCACVAEVSGSGEVKDLHCQSGPSAGIVQGRINNIGLLSVVIAGILKKLQASCGLSFKSVQVSLESAGVFSRNSHSVIPLSERANKIITSADIRKVYEQAYSLGLNIEEDVLHSVIQGYTIDNQNRVLHPEGLYGHRLELDLLLISVLATDLESLISSVNQAGFRAGSVVLAGLAASEAVVNKLFRDKGCFFLDIGFEYSQMLAFKDGILRGVEVFNFGSRFLRDALARELRIPAELAQEIKVSYGNALAGNIDPDQEVLLKKDQIYRPVKRKAICSIIENQLQGLFSPLKASLERYRANEGISEAIIVAGDIVSLDGFLESMEIVFSLPVHLGRIENMPSSDLKYTTAIGLIKYAIASAPNFHLFRMVSYGNIVQSVIRKAKEVYQEYF